MFLTILIAFVSLISLVVLHELGHFILAKKFGVRVEEFGIGLPPRLFGKKIGETIFSINLLPLGAFVKIYGEEERKKDPRSFSQKPIWQRALIVLGGVVTFWIIAAILLSIIFGLGAPIAVGDGENHDLVNPKVQVVAVVPGSPAADAGLKIEDIIRQLETPDSQLRTDKVKEVVEFIQANKGKEVVLTIQRGEELFDVSLIPRVEPPEGEGAIGVGLARTVMKAFPWYQAPIQGILATGNLTIAMVQGWGRVLGSLLKEEGIPPGVEIAGPVKIFIMIGERIKLGFVDFLFFIAMISIALALFNILPIPALDGGKLLFLGIEKIRGRPVSQKIEQNITAFFFFLLISLVIFVTIRDIKKFF